jgi:uncharacterized DUF497 family protein
MVFLLRKQKTVFDDPLYVDFYDPDHSYGERRFILLGKSAQGRLLFVSYMERNNGIRLINARAERSIGKRSGRIEPKAIKRRPKPYPLLTKTRSEAREEVRKYGHPKKLK